MNAAFIPETGSVAAAAGALSLGGEALVRRVRHLLEGEAEGGGDVDGADAYAAGEHLEGPRGGTGAVANRQDGSHECAHHGVAERVRPYVRLEDSVSPSCPRELEQRPGGRAAHPPPTERPEVPVPDQRRRPCIEGVHVQGTAIRQDLAAAQRVSAFGRVSHAVDVPA